jgi:hypothetical protein
MNACSLQRRHRARRSSARRSSARRRLRDEPPPYASVKHPGAARSVRPLASLARCRRWRRRSISPRPTPPQHPTSPSGFTSLHGSALRHFTALRHMSVKQNPQITCLPLTRAAEGEHGFGEDQAPPPTRAAGGAREHLRVGASMNRALEIRDESAADFGPAVGEPAVGDLRRNAEAHRVQGAGVPVETDVLVLLGVERGHQVGLGLR